MTRNRYYQYGLILFAALFVLTAALVIVTRDPARGSPTRHHPATTSAPAPGETHSEWWNEEGSPAPVEFRVTSVKVSYMTGRKSMEITTVDGVTPDSRVAKVEYTFKNLGKDEITVTPETMSDTLGRTYDGQWVIHPRDTAAPGTEGYGHAFAVVAPDAKINTIGLNAWGPGGVGTDGRGTEEVRITG